MEEWKEYRLEDVCDIKIGRTPPRNEHEWFNQITPSFNWVSIKDMGVCGKYITKTSETISKEGQGKFNIPIVYPHTVLLSFKLTVGRVAITGENPMLTNEAIAQLSIKNERILDKDYLFYYLKNFKFQQLGSTSSIATAINSKTIREIPIILPSIRKQQYVSSILSSLDDKIEINRRINENLEQQAQALFKSWFVDFEPFRNQPFVESELGMIPEGWRVGRYDDIIETTISGDWGKEKQEGNYTHKVACVRGCDFQDIKNGLRGRTPERYIIEKNFQAKHFKDKDLLVEISGGTATVSTGRVCPISQLLIDKYNQDIVCTNFCKLVRPKSSYGAYLYYSWLFKYNSKVMFGYENGTSGIKNFRIKDFTSIEPVVIPTESSLQPFQALVDKLQMKMQLNGAESQKLAELRDTLLPRLMSGELKVNEIEQ